ncbi:MAG: IS630 family transposase [Leptolyngbyaceae cyanobacterium SM1_3_5]|nr:IS630 family transposase [Leptolyngbyaceae cyanobacterium SM1_3_5]
MSAPYSYDLRTKAIEAIGRGEPKTKVCQMLKISRNTLDLWLKRKQETGDYQAITHFQTGSRHKITDWNRFAAFVKEHGDKTQAQMAKVWGEGVTQQNISDALKKLGISRKKTYGYPERDEVKRREFQERLKTKPSELVIYIDEAGIDNREDYPYGYCEIGQRFHALKSGKRTERVSWIAALVQGQLIAPMTFTGACNRDLFEMWLEQSLLPQLQPGSVIVIDNASFHRSCVIDELVAQAGCELWYLPPYSPDLNKIERWWSVLKNWMRQRMSEFDSFRDCVDAAFKHCPNVLA